MHIISRAGAWVKLLPAILITVLIIITQTGCGEKDPVSKSDFCLDTTCDIKIYDMKTGEAGKILDGAFEEIDKYENLMSKTIEGSDVYKINHAQGQPVEVSKDTLKVIELGIEMGDLSGGMFDITIGKVSSLWNFTGDDPKVPEQADLTEALKSVNYKQIDINDSAVSMKDPQAQLDLGGVAKGYIADRICDYLKNQGVEKAVINLGGNVAVLGEKGKDTPWNIAIERPYSDRTEMMGYVSVKDATVVTSGIYERKFEQDGVLYHRVLLDYYRLSGGYGSGGGDHSCCKGEFRLLRRAFHRVSDAWKGQGADSHRNAAGGASGDETGSRLYRQKRRHDPD